MTDERSRSPHGYLLYPRNVEELAESTAAQAAVLGQPDYDARSDAVIATASSMADLSARFLQLERTVAELEAGR